MGFWVQDLLTASVSWQMIFTFSNPAVIHLCSLALVVAACNNRSVRLAVHAALDLPHVTTIIAVRVSATGVLALNALNKV
jgi:hypothetical protein